MKERLTPAIKRTLGIAALACALPAAYVTAQPTGSGGDAAGAGTSEGWQQMQEEVLSVEAILNADVHNGLNPIGNVDRLVLSEDGSRIEYIVYDVPYPYSFYGAQNGFTTFEGIDFHYGLADLTVRFDPEVEPQAPEEFQLTRQEAESRLLDNVLGENMSFENDEIREVQDLLVDRDTGEILYYVVDMEADSLFGSDRRTIPADIVSIENDGRIVASTDVRGVEDIQQAYDEAYL